MLFLVKDPYSKVVDVALKRKKKPARKPSAVSWCILF